ncbi:MAG TPA: thioredoxin family protein [Candidatus Bilamarchaeum sp.]|nr:thioredoxin family protein [Candidatus Bilamarchaeum sp.]
MEFKPNNPILVMLAVALITASILFVLSFKSQMAAGYTDGNGTDALAKKAALFSRAPELQGISGYINAPEGFRLSDVKGKVVIVDFWTYSCINCIRTLPYLTAWDEKYRDEGLVIVGVHTPEFQFEKDKANVEKAVGKYGIKYPVVQDNDFGTWNAYGNLYWPHKYIIDADGFIRYDHIGEGGYEETEEVIQKLLQERDEKLQMGALVSSNITSNTSFGGIGTPEIYFGYGLALPARNFLGNPEGFRPEQTVAYSLPSVPVKNYAYLEGNWTNKNDYMELASDTGKVVLKYQAKNVNIVAGEPANLTIRLDGRDATAAELGSDGQMAGGRPVVMTDGHTLYRVVDDEGYYEKTLEIDVKGKGFRIYTFTFG